MSIAPFRGRCFWCGHDHGQLGFPGRALENDPMPAELSRLRAENETLRRWIDFIRMNSKFAAQLADEAMEEQPDA